MPRVKTENEMSTGRNMSLCWTAPFSFFPFRPLFDPFSEICALDWSEIDLKAKTIEVKAAKAKTRQRRIGTIQDNLLAWLEKPCLLKGPVAPDVDVFGEKLKHLVKGRKPTDDDPGRPAIVQEWPHNALRHSFGSYHYARFKNENLTAAEMGNSPGVVFKHYGRWSSRRGLTPTGESCRRPRELGLMPQANTVRVVS
jgi:integrase